MATQKIRFTSFTLPTSVKALLRGGTSTAQTSTTISTITGTERREVTFADLTAGVYTFLAYNGSTLLGAVDISIEAATGTYEPPYAATTGDITDAVTDALGGVAVEISSPVISNQEIELVVGDDYYNADGAALTFTFTGISADFTGGAATLRLRQRNVESNVEGTIVTATGSTRVVRFELPSATTEDYSPGGGFFSVEVQLANDHKRTLLTEGTVKWKSKEYA